MLDAVLRRGQTMDNAAQHAHEPAAGRRRAGQRDRRRDAAPPARPRRADRQRDPPAACPTTPRRGWCCASRWPRRSALGTPDHALVATALPLVDGGPRRLVHGVLGTLLRQGVPPLDVPRLPEPRSSERWRAAWGEEVVAAAAPRDRQRPAARPQLRQRRSRAGLPTASASLPAPPPARPQQRGRRAARLRRGRLVGAGSRRLAPRAADPGRRHARARPVRRAGRQDDAARRRRARRHRARPLAKVVWHDLRENLARTGLEAETVVADVLRLDARRAVRRDPARRALLGDRHLPPPSRSALPRPARDHRRRWPSPGASCSPAPPTG